MDKAKADAFANAGIFIVKNNNNTQVNEKKVPEHVVRAAQEFHDKIAPQLARARRGEISEEEFLQHWKSVFPHNPYVKATTAGIMASSSGPQAAAAGTGNRGKGKATDSPALVREGAAAMDFGPDYKQTMDENQRYDCMWEIITGAIEKCHLGKITEEEMYAMIPKLADGTSVSTELFDSIRKETILGMELEANPPGGSKHKKKRVRRPKKSKAAAKEANDLILAAHLEAKATNTPFKMPPGVTMPTSSALPQPKSEDELTAKHPIVANTDRSRAPGAPAPCPRLTLAELKENRKQAMLHAMLSEMTAAAAKLDPILYAHGVPRDHKIFAPIAAKYMRMGVLWGDGANAGQSSSFGSAATSSTKAAPVAAKPKGPMKKGQKEDDEMAAIDDRIRTLELVLKESRENERITAENLARHEEKHGLKKTNLAYYNTSASVAEEDRGASGSAGATSTLGAGSSTATAANVSVQAEHSDEEKDDMGKLKNETMVQFYERMADIEREREKGIAHSKKMAEEMARFDESHDKFKADLAGHKKWLEEFKAKQAAADIKNEDD